MSVLAAWMTAGAVLVAASTIGSAARAQAPDSVGLDEFKDVARAKAERGLELYAAEEWAEAYENFRVAEELFHAPTLVLLMAHCQRNLGNLIQARDLYAQTAAEEVAEDATDAFQNAIVEAQGELDTIEGKIPRVTFRLSGVPRDTASVSVNGKAVALDQEIEINPGTLQIEGYATDARPLYFEVVIPEGDRRTIDVEFQPIEREVAPPPAPPPPPPPPQTRYEPGSLVPGFVALGIGVAGVGVGAVTGGMVLSRVSDLEQQCGGTVCPTELQAEADDAAPLATVSTVGFIVGGIGLAAGAALLILRPGGEQVTVGVHPTGLSVAAVFE